MTEKTIIVGLTVLLLSSTGYALDPIGPPKSLLSQGHWALGLEYAYSETDVDLSDGGGLPNTSSVLEASRAYVNVRYGARKNIDVFARLGAAVFDVSMLQEGDADLAWGLGAAVTLRDADKVDWGLLVQASRGESEAHGAPPVFPTPSEVEAWTLQVAAGPTYEVRDDLAAYGGIFLNVLSGDFDGTPFVWNDMDGNDPAGLFVGLDWTVKEDAHWTVEFQYAGDTMAVATGLRWVFE